MIIMIIKCSNTDSGFSLTEISKSGAAKGTFAMSFCI